MLRCSRILRVCAKRCGLFWGNSRFFPRVSRFVGSNRTSRVSSHCKNATPTTLELLAHKTAPGGLFALPVFRFARRISLGFNRVMHFTVQFDHQFGAGAVKSTMYRPNAFCRKNRIPSRFPPHKTRHRISSAGVEFCRCAF